MMSEKNSGEAPIVVYGMANIGCDQREATFQTLVQGDRAEQQEAEEEKQVQTPAADEEHDREELFHFIHPAVDTEQEEWQIHNQVKRLLKRQGIQEICRYLQQLQQEGKILLPQGVEAAYNELQRMGMPSGEGFSYKTFQRYYNKG